ncbi:MAG: patatin-like phospholipase family protein [Candidatus Cybelea sp.]
MKGGVTSGIVYPRTLCHLATQFNLRNIGGTSVGAIAASIVAAAEYQRRKTGSAAGYLAFAKVPEFLARDDSLIRLFAADATAAPLVRIGLKFIGSAPLWKRLFSVTFGLIKEYWLKALVPVLALAYCFLAPDLFAAMPGPRSGIAASWALLTHAIVPVGILAFFFLLILLSFAFLQCWSVLTKNDYGFCHAYDPGAAASFQASLTRLTSSEKDISDLEAGDTPPLFNWLEAYIAHAAGRTMDDPPLTIGDLRTVKFPEWFTDDGQPSIDFQTVTTCLTLGRPFGLPFDSERAGHRTGLPNRRPDRPKLYFLESDLRKYFSDSVLAHLKAKGDKADDVSPVDDRGNPLGDVYRFPTGEDLPLVVAVRMSMSFPILFCAVRLWAQSPDGRSLRPMWFSDGGLSSNFPIHLFDSPLPRWPTFALDLLDGGTAQRVSEGKVIVPVPPSDAFLESDDSKVPLESSYPLSGPGGRGSLLQFASAMLDAIRTWQDSILGALPGNASRTIGIRLPQDEGGLNLTMTRDQVLDLIARGDLAGSTLTKLFVPDEPEHYDTPAWRTQRWLRFLATMEASTQWLTSFQSGYASRHWLRQDTYKQLCERNYMCNQQAPDMRPPLIQWRDLAEAIAATAGSDTLAGLPLAARTTSAFQAGAPVPEATLRLRAPL